MASSRDLILLNVTKKNGVAYSGQIAVDVADITAPIVDGGGSPIVVYVKNSTSNVQGDNVNVDAWTVSDSLSAIANQDFNLAIIPIIKVDSRGTQHPTTYSPAKDICFYLPSIVGAAENDTTGCHFLFNIQGDPVPVKYYSNLSVSALIATLPISGITGALTPTRIPYASATTVLSDSWFERTTIGVALDNGKSLTSATASKSTLNFGSGDQFLFTTDGGAFNEAWIFATPTDGGFGVDNDDWAWVETNAMAGGPYTLLSGRLDGNFVGMTGVITDAGALTVLGYNPKAIVVTESKSLVAHPDLVSLASPAIQMPDNATFDIDTLNGTAVLFNSNASVVNLGRSGANLSVASTLSMQLAMIYMAPSDTGHATFNIPAGVAPTLPSDGDVYFDGTDIKIRVSGAWKTFTIV